MISSDIPKGEHTFATQFCLPSIKMQFNLSFLLHKVLEVNVSTLGRVKLMDLLRILIVGL